MAKEKFIRGKRDNCHHDGLFSIRKREQESEDKLRNWEVDMLPNVEYTLHYENQMQIAIQRTSVSPLKGRACPEVGESVLQID